MSERKKTLIYIGIFIIMLGMAATLLTHIGKNNQKTSKINQIQLTKILEVGEQDFEKEVLQSDQKVLIDFYATWCGPCRILKTTLNEFAKEYDNIKVVEIDVDKASNLSSKYGVMSIPTLVVIENGQEINRIVGAVPKEKIIEICGLIGGKQ